MVIRMSSDTSWSIHSEYNRDSLWLKSEEEPCRKDLIHYWCLSLLSALIETYSRLQNNFTRSKIRIRILLLLKINKKIFSYNL